MRTDITDILIHFTKRTAFQSADEVLRTILRDKQLIAGNKFIRSRDNCICFSEAPLVALAGSGLVNPNGFSRYEPYGIAFSKRDVFARGGRPVIYQPDSEFDALSLQSQWRHVRFELGDTDIDFTWEREWRLCEDRMSFQPQDISVILPDEAARSRLINEVERDSFYEAWAYTTVLGDIAWTLDEGNPWSIVTLSKRKGESISSAR